MVNSRFPLPDVASRRWLLAALLLVSSIQAAAAFGLSAVSRAQLREKPQAELRKLSKTQWLGLLRSSELPVQRKRFVLRGRPCQILHLPCPKAAASAPKVLSDAAVPGGDSSDQANASSLFGFSSNATALPEDASNVLPDNTTETSVNGTAFLEDASVSDGSLMTLVPATLTPSNASTMPTESTVTLDNAIPPSAAVEGVASAALVTNSSMVQEAASAALVSNSSMVQDGILLEVKPATHSAPTEPPASRPSLRTGMSAPSPAASLLTGRNMTAHLTSARLLGSRVRPSEIPHQTMPTLESAMQVSDSSGSDLSHALEGGDGRGSAPSTIRIIVAILLAAATLLCGVLVYDKIVKHSAPSSEVADASAQVRQWARSLPVISGDEVKGMFRDSGGYDCLLMQPQAAPGAVRLEGRVVALPHNVLKAPLARRDCVLFNTSASVVRLDGIRAPPTAYSAMNSDFDLELLGTSLGSTDISIRIRGRDVALFDVASGWRLERTVLADASEQLQDFLHAHRGPDVNVPDASEVLDFNECLLPVGAHVTCIGELRRDPTGELVLLPLQDSCGTQATSSTGTASHSPPRGVLSQLTSWERAECLTPPRSPRVGKVMISDDPALLGQSGQTFYSRLVNQTRNLFKSTGR